MDRTFTNQKKLAMIPQKERLRVFLSIGIAALIFLFGIWSMLRVPSASLHTREFKSAFKQYGSIARIGLFIVLAHYAFVFILQKRLANQWNMIKNGIVLLSRFARKWHTPIAVITIGIIVVHVAGAFLYGIQLDFNNISGLLALLMLLPVPVSGLLRYRRMDRKWHLRFGLGFAVLFLIHAFL